MSEVKVLVKKATTTLKTEGPGMVARKTMRYLAFKINNRADKERNKPDRTFADVLFINGCCLPHPSRYRVNHQREQLWAGDISSNEVFYTDLTLEMVRMYRIFIFFRCPYTDLIGKFIEMAKDNHKKVLYDIDDLMIDKSYTSTISYIATMTEQEKKSYYEGIDLNQKLLKLCEGAITTTERMAEELQKFVPKVYINRNVASEEMLRLSEKALKENKKHDQKISMGYFSGSITHNADFEMILPVISKIMQRYENVFLVVCGELDIPNSLKNFSDRIEKRPFGDWRKLPELIASVDINLAPLENSIFNEAKSENKWVEAALVKVPTVASNVGAFKKMIENKKTGFLCDNLMEWEKTLTELIENKELREDIGKDAYNYCKENCTSVYTAAKFAEYIKKIMNPNIVFILPGIQISGGALVILKHCVILKEYGFDVTVFHQGDEKENWIDKDGTKLNVVSYRDSAIAMHIDKAVATLWATVHFFEEYSKIKQRYYNVQNFETDFYESGDYFKIEANRTYCTDLPIKYITISKWCEDWLKNKYGKESTYAPNGIYVDRFYPKKRKWDGRKVRILIEGNSEDYYKNVDESFKIVDLLDKDKFEIWYLSYLGEPKKEYYVDKFLHKVPYEDVPNVYRECDILIKSSILESFSYPPLEMMATGGYVVVAPNAGNIEYLKDRENCLFYEHEDLNTAMNALDLIMKDKKLREKLYENGIETAKKREWKNIKTEILKLYGV